MFSVPIDTFLSPSEILVKDPEVTRQYSQLAKSTFEADLKELVDMKLLIKAEDKYLANTSNLLASLPERRESSRT
jgi:hypothetical protein